MQIFAILMIQSFEDLPLALLSNFIGDLVLKLFQAFNFASSTKDF